jgi:hypothetical protein
MLDGASFMSGECGFEAIDMDVSAMARRGTIRR